MEKKLKKIRKVMKEEKIKFIEAEKRIKERKLMKKLDQILK